MSLSMPSWSGERGAVSQIEPETKEGREESRWNGKRGRELRRWRERGEMERRGSGNERSIVGR